MDKHDVVDALKEALQGWDSLSDQIIRGLEPRLLDRFKYLLQTWNTDDNRTYEEWLSGVKPYSLEDME